MMDAMDGVLARAFRAYFATAKRTVDTPSVSRSFQTEINDKSYIVLSNSTGILAVYRVRNDGMLKRLRRWPAELGEERINR
jgi:hypothetical protein